MNNKILIGFVIQAGSGVIGLGLKEYGLLPVILGFIGIIIGGTIACFGFWHLINPPLNK